MNSYVVLSLLALAFSCSLTGFVYAARHRGWSIGEIFQKERIPAFVAVLCVVSAIGILAAAVIHGGSPWWVFLIGVASYFVGGPMIMAVAGSYSGMVSLVAAPTSILVALMMQAT